MGSCHWLDDPYRKKKVFDVGLSPSIATAIGQTIFCPVKSEKLCYGSAQAHTSST